MSTYTYNGGTGTRGNLSFYIVEQITIGNVSYQTDGEYYPVTVKRWLHTNMGTSGLAISGSVCNGWTSVSAGNNGTTTVINSSYKAGSTVSVGSCSVSVKMNGVTASSSLGAKSFTMPAPTSSKISDVSMKIINETSSEEESRTVFNPNDLGFQLAATWTPNLNTYKYKLEIYSGDNLLWDYDEFIEPKSTSAYTFTTGNLYFSKLLNMDNANANSFVEKYFTNTSQSSILYIRLLTYNESDSQIGSANDYNLSLVLNGEGNNSFRPQLTGTYTISSSKQGLNAEEIYVAADNIIKVKIKEDNATGAITYGGAYISNVSLNFEYNTNSDISQDYSDGEYNYEEENSWNSGFLTTAGIENISLIYTDSRGFSNSVIVKTGLEIGEYSIWSANITGAWRCEIPKSEKSEINIDNNASFCCLNGTISLNNCYALGLKLGFEFFDSNQNLIKYEEEESDPITYTILPAIKNSGKWNGNCYEIAVYKESDSKYSDIDLSQFGLGVFDPAGGYYNDNDAIGNSSVDNAYYVKLYITDCVTSTASEYGPFYLGTSYSVVDIDSTGQSIGLLGANADIIEAGEDKYTLNIGGVSKQDYTTVNINGSLDCLNYKINLAEESNLNEIYANTQDKYIEYIEGTSENFPITSSGWLTVKSYFKDNTYKCRQIFIDDTYGNSFQRVGQIQLDIDNKTWVATWNNWRGGFSNYQLLWSGNVSNGNTIQVPNSTQYNIFIARIYSELTMLIGIRTLNDNSPTWEDHNYGETSGKASCIRFVNALDNATTSSIYKATFEQTANSDTWKLIAASSHTLTSSGNTGTTKSIASIYGVC